MQKMMEKNEKMIIFMNFYAISKYVCGRKVKLCRYFICKKLEKIMLKNMSKMENHAIFKKF